LAACGAFHGPAVENATLIPWINATPAAPTPTPAPVIPAGTHACTLADLNVVYEGGQGLGGGQLTAAISFENLSGIACVLQGVPGFALLDDHGNVIRTTPSGYRITDRIDAVLLVPRSGRQEAYVPFAWPAIDQATGGGPCPSASAASQIRLELPQGGGTVTLSTASPTLRPMAIAPCHGLIAVGSFQVVEPYVEPTPTPHSFAYHVALPPSVRAGDSLMYTVTITNITAASVVFSDPCPAYREDLFPVVSLARVSPLGKHRYLLNCRPAGTIDSRASVTFAMVLDVPATATPGSYTLLWAPDEGADTQDIQRVPITIVGSS
jgi:hypothetical protein